jgi:hypothetical protein
MFGFPYLSLKRAGGAMDVSAIAKLVGGLGMFLLGIHHLTEGIKDLAGDSLRRALTRLVAGRVSAIASGVVFTALIQSSTAAILTVIGFVSAGLMTFAQAIGVIMGATLGPCASSCWRTSRSSASARRRRAPASISSRGRTALSITQRAWRGRCTAKPKSESRGLAPAAPGAAPGLAVLVLVI